VTPREAWNEAGDELGRTGRALRKAAAKELYYKANAAETAAYRRMLREEREQGTT
jgi:hypothetical protein